MSLRHLPGACLFAAFLLAVASPARAQVVDPFNPTVSGGGAGVVAMAAQRDGKVVIAGDFTSVAGVPRQRIARLNRDGSLDLTFDPGVSGFAYCLAIQDDGKILVGGFFNGLGGSTGTTPRQSLGRLNPDGTVDPDFNPFAGTLVAAMAVQPDGKILVGGDLSSFGTGPSLVFRENIARLNPDGTVDMSFDPGADDLVYSVSLQSDGRILVGGAFTGLGGGFGTVSRSYIGRLEADGTVDLSFNPGANDEVNLVQQHPDGRIFVAGPFTGLGGGTGNTPRARIGMINLDGSIDSFDAGVDAEARSAVITAAGDIILGGSFSTVTGASGGGSFSRQRIARLSSSGAVDPNFNPGAAGSWAYVAAQHDGRVLVGGFITGLGGGTGVTPRAGIGRLSAVSAATDRITVSGGGTVITWTRAGAGPHVSTASFSYSVDGMNYVELGRATRVGANWQLTGVTLPVDPNLRIRARGAASGAYVNNSTSAVIVDAPVSTTNMIENSTMDSDAAGWSTCALPNAGGMTSITAGGLFQFYRTGTQAVVLQRTKLPVPFSSVIYATFRIGNTAPTRRRISVLMHDDDFTDLAVCTFWLPANMPLSNYAMRTRTTRAWTNADISFYAATVAADGFYQLDDVTMQYQPAATEEGTWCVDPLVPAPTTGSTGPEMLTNSNLNTGALAPWTTFGTISTQVVDNELQFIRPTSIAPSGVVFQSSGVPLAANTIIGAGIRLGNSSSVRKRVTVILHDIDFSDLTACTFWLAPYQPANVGYIMYAHTTKAWSNATLSIYPATVGIEEWIRADDATFVTTPSVPTTGTNCVFPEFVPGG